LLALSLLKAKVPVGARCVFEVKDRFEKSNVVTTIHLFKTGFKVHGVYEGFLRLERVE
jgi:hypothetical protein